MAANVENMFYTGREVPWHGLGVQVSDAPTSSDAIKLAGLDWKVIQEDLMLGNGNKIEGYKANVRETDGSILGVVSNRYQVVQNDEAFSFCDNLLGEGVRFETAGSLAGGKRNFILAQMPGDYKLLDDSVDPFLVFTNSHDGKGSIVAAMTPVRVVCQNTLNLALATSKRSWSTCHKGNIQGKLDEAMMTLRMGEAYMKNLQAGAEELAKIQVPDSRVMEYIQLLMPIDKKKSERSQRNTADLQIALLNRYMYAPDLQHVDKNGYRFVNAVSDFATHHEPLRKTQNFNENRFAKTIDGNALIDKSYDMMISLLPTAKVSSILVK